MKHSQIRNEIKSRIERGIYSAGSRIPDTIELAKEFKCATVTINKAVTALAANGLLERIKSQGTFVLNKINENPFTGRRKERIGFVFNGFLHSFLDAHFAKKVHAGLEYEINKANKSLVVVPLEKKSIDTILKEVEFLSVSGVVVYSLYNNDLYAGLKALKIPFVCVDFIDFGLKADQVTTDHLRGGSLAVRQLAKCGHRNVLFFGHKMHTSKNDPDHEYWFKAASAESSNIGIKSIKSCFVSFMTKTKMREKIKEMLLGNRDSTGYICGSTTFYRLVKDIVETENDLVKESRDLILFSDWFEHLEMNGKAIYQCRWNTYEMGTTAAKIILDRAEGGTYKPQMVYVPIEITQ